MNSSSNTNIVNTLKSKLNKNLVGFIMREKLLLPIAETDGNKCKDFNLDEVNFIIPKNTTKIVLQSITPINNSLNNIVNNSLNNVENNREYICDMV